MVTIDIGRKEEWAAVPLSRGELATIDMGRKFGGGCALFSGSWVPI